MISVKIITVITIIQTQNNHEQEISIQDHPPDLTNPLLKIDQAPIQNMNLEESNLNLSDEKFI